MKTSLFNGYNTGKLDFDYNIRYRPRINVSPLNMKRQTEYLFKCIDYEQIYYVWENDKYSNHKHSHNLIKTFDTDLINKLLINIESINAPLEETREKLIRKQKYITNINTGERILKEVDTLETIISITMKGKHGELYIEPIQSKVASAIYINKFTDYGANTGYLMNPLKFPFI